MPMNLNLKLFFFQIRYGFRGNPKLTLVAKPKVGARQVTVTHITDWIERKLSVEFQVILLKESMIIENVEGVELIELYMYEEDHSIVFVQMKCLAFLQRTIVLPNMDDLVIPLFNGYNPHHPEDKTTPA